MRNLCFLILVLILPFVKAVTPAARSCKSTCQPAWKDMVTQGCKWEVKRVKMNSHICYSCSYFFRVFFTLHSHANSSLGMHYHGRALWLTCTSDLSFKPLWLCSGWLLSLCPTSWCSFKEPSWFFFLIISYCPQHPLLFREATLTMILVS